jgi:hypothetical protein
MTTGTRWHARYALSAHVPPGSGTARPTPRELGKRVDLIEISETDCLLTIFRWPGVPQIFRCGPVAWPDGTADDQAGFHIQG